jgi:hypothetical protein
MIDDGVLEVPIDLETHLVHGHPAEVWDVRLQRQAALTRTGAKLMANDGGRSPDLLMRQWLR